MNLINLEPFDREIPFLQTSLLMTRSALLTLAALLALLATLHAAEATQEASSSTPDPNTAEELRVREGLPNFFAKLAAVLCVCCGVGV